MLTIIWSEADIPITFKKRYSFWRKGFAYVIVQLPNGMIVGDNVAVLRKLGWFCK